ncbi:hypothetical protein BGX26_005585, partial [Mortierella sp. AD094]
MLADREENRTTRDGSTDGHLEVIISGSHNPQGAPAEATIRNPQKFYIFEEKTIQLQYDTL